MTELRDRPHPVAAVSHRTFAVAIASAITLLAACSSDGAPSTATLPPLLGAPTTLVLTTEPSTTLAAGATTVVASAASTVAGSSSTSTSIPATTLPPSTTTTAAAVSWGGWGYYSVPQLGSEPVRGSGCGANGSIGEVVPDGIWNVIIGDGSGATRFWSGGSMQVDLRCVYAGSAGQAQWNAVCGAAPDADACLAQSPDWFVVNVNSRLRTMPVAPAVQYGVGALGSTPCPGVALDPTSTDAPWRYMDSWIVVSGGVVTAVVAACPAG